MNIKKKIVNNYNKSNKKNKSNKHNKSNKQYKKSNKQYKKSNKQYNKSNIGGESNNISNSYIFSSSRLTTQENKDPNYKEVGIIHITESGAINVLRNAATDFANIFGHKGFDNVIFDQARNEALQKLYNTLTPNQKVCSIKMDIENLTISKLFFVHIYGTLLEKK